MARIFRHCPGPLTDKQQCSSKDLLGSSSEKVSSHTVLVVEDDPLVQEVLCDIVSSLGFDVLTATNGAEAVSLFEDSCDEICCVILDFEIPGMHSSTALSMFREMNSRVKVLLSSGYPESHITGNFPLERIDGFIPKPYEPQLLMSELGKLVDD